MIDPRGTFGISLRRMILVMALFYAGATGHLFGQEDSTSNLRDEGLNWWADFGLGLGASRSGSSALGVGGGISLQIAPSMLVTARSSYVQDIIPCLFCDAPPRYTADVAALCGLLGKSDLGHVSVASGAALVFYRDVDYGEDEPVIRTGTTLGLPIEVQFMFTPLPYLGIGFVGTGNVNFESSFGGLFLALQVGDVR